MHVLIGLHAVLGEIGALAFIWVFVEMMSPSQSGLKRARNAALLGTLLLIGAWIAGGFYYVTQYGALVKPVILDGPLPWTHAVFTETKEHVFLFLPFLGAIAWGLLRRYQNEFIQNRDFRIAMLLISGIIVIIAFSMAGMGFIISSGFRAALEAKVI